MAENANTSNVSPFDEFRSAMGSYYEAKSRWWGMRDEPNKTLTNYDYVNSSKKPFADNNTVEICGHIGIDSVEGHIKEFDRLLWLFRYLHPHGRSHYQKRRALLCCYYANEFIRFQEKYESMTMTKDDERKARHACDRLAYHSKRLPRFSRIRTPLKHYVNAIDKENLRFKAGLHQGSPSGLLLKRKFKKVRLQVRRLLRKAHRPSFTRKGATSMFTQDNLYSRRIHRRLQELAVANHKQAEANALQCAQISVEAFKSDCAKGEEEINAYIAVHRDEKEACFERLRASLKALFTQYTSCVETHFNNATKTKCVDTDGRYAQLYEELNQIWRESQTYITDLMRGFAENKPSHTNSTAMVISETRVSSKKRSVKIPLGQTWQEDARELDKLQAIWKEELASVPKETIMVKYAEIQQTITKKYRELAMRYHPDKNPGQQKEQSEAIFKEACNTIDAIREELQGVLKRRNSDKDLSDKDWCDIQNWDAEFSRRIEEVIRGYQELNLFWIN